MTCVRTRAWRVPEERALPGAATLGGVLRNPSRARPTISSRGSAGPQPRTGQVSPHASSEVRWRLVAHQMMCSSELPCRCHATAVSPSRNEPIAASQWASEVHDPHICHAGICDDQRPTRNLQRPSINMAITWQRQSLRMEGCCHVAAMSPPHCRHIPAMLLGSRRCHIAAMVMP